MPKFFISEHVKKERAEKDAAAKVAQRDLCQAVGEHVALERQEIRKKREAEQRQELQKRIEADATAGKEAHDDINELLDEGWTYSLQLANQKVRNRIETLTLDRTFYHGEIKMFTEKEMDPSFLEDTLESVETEVSELNIDLELSTLSTKGVNHEKD